MVTQRWAISTMAQLRAESNVGMGDMREDDIPLRGKWKTEVEGRKVRDTKRKKECRK